jgi:hypothetical protein
MWILILISFAVVCVAGYLLLTSYKKGSGDLNEHINTIQAEKFSPDMNRWAAGKEGKAATARATTAESLNREAAAVAEMHRKQAEATQAAFDRKEASFRAEEARKQEQSAHDLFMTLTREALDEGISVEALVEVKTKRLMDEAERTHQVQLKQQAILLGLIAKHLQEHQTINQLQIQLDGLYLEMAEIESGTYRGQPIPNTARAMMIADRKKTVATIKKDKNGREQRLLQAYNKKASGRDDKDSDLR